MVLSIFVAAPTLSMTSRRAAHGSLHVSWLWYNAFLVPATVPSMEQALC